jgi:hypothetical protein
MANEHAAPAPPGAQVVLDLWHGGDVRGVARQDPGAHPNAVADNRERQRRRRPLGPVRGMAVPAQLRPAVLIVVVDREPGGGGVIGLVR